ncbi:MAG: hypothetical protein ACLQT6_11145 [Desulfomonilaceae bacterium]
MRLLMFLGQNYMARIGPSSPSLLLKVADRIDENAQKLAMMETMDNGKPIREHFGHNGY